MKVQLHAAVAMDGFSPMSHGEQAGLSKMRGASRVSPDPCQLGGFTKCAASIRSKTTVGAPVDPSCVPKVSIPRFHATAAGPPLEFTAKLATSAAGCQSAIDKKQLFRSKLPKSKADLRAAAAANAFADLCSDHMPAPPECPKPIPRRRTKSRPASSNNAGAPYIVSDEHRSGTIPKQSEPSFTFTADWLRHELSSSMRLPVGERKRMFQSLCRQWHPDKNPGNEKQATILFQVLQEEKERFLDIREGRDLKLDM